MKLFAALVLAALPIWPLVAQTAAPTPKLIVAISVDQFSADLFSEYRGRMSGGLKRLTAGAVFPRGHQSHAATETCPGHSTILTGSRPARSGIVANDWQNPRMKRGDSYDVYCAEDETLPGTTGSNYVVSPVHLKVPTLGDRLKAADPATRVVSIAGKDRSAVMMGGHKADVTLWWDGKAFVTYMDSKVQLPAALKAINGRAQATIDKPSGQRLPPSCVRYSRAISVRDTKTVGKLPAKGLSGRASPQFDTLIAELAIATFNEMKLGQGAAPDVLAIGLSATDYIGHTYGTRGAEMCVGMVGLDATLGRIFAALDRSKVPYAVVLTADHGGHDLPERNRQDGLPMAERVDPALSAAIIGGEVAKQMKREGSVLIERHSAGDMYMIPELDKDQRKVAQEAAVAAYRAHPQVHSVYTWADVMAATEPSGPVDEWSLMDRIKASFDPERSGDFYVVLKPYVTPIPAGASGVVATHGSIWGYDRRVPMLFWWKGMTGFEQPNAVETVDILPTLASLTGLAIPAGEIDGRCLDLLAGEADNCPK